MLFDRVLNTEIYAARCVLLAIAARLERAEHAPTSHAAPEESSVFRGICGVACGSCPAFAGNNSRMEGVVMPLPVTWCVPPTLRVRSWKGRVPSSLAVIFSPPPAPISFPRTKNILDACRLRLIGSFGSLFSVFGWGFDGMAAWRQIINVFLVTTIAGTLLDTVSEIVEEPAKTFTLLGEALPKVPFTRKFVCLRSGEGAPTLQGFSTRESVSRALRGWASSTVIPC